MLGVEEAAGRLSMVLAYVPGRSLEAAAAGGPPEPARVRAPRNAGIAARPGTVAILPFEIVTGDPSLDWLEPAPAELLGSALTHSGMLDVFDARRLEETAVQERGSGPGTPARSRCCGTRPSTGRSPAPSCGRTTGCGCRGASWTRQSGASSGRRESRAPRAATCSRWRGGLIPDLQAAIEVHLSGHRESEAWLREITTSSADAYRDHMRGHQALVAARWVDARAAPEQAVERDGNFAAAWADLAGTCWNIGDAPRLESARAHLRRLRGQVDAASRLRIDQMEAIVGGNSQEVFRTSRAVIALSPEIRFYRYLLGRGYPTNGEHRRSIEALAPLVAQRYEWPWTYMLVSRSYRELGVPDSAEVALRMGLEATDRNPELSLELGLMLEQRADAAEAPRTFEAARSSPSFAQTPMWQGRILLELGRLNAADGAGDSARAQLDRALASLPPEEPRREKARELPRQLGR